MDPSTTLPIDSPTTCVPAPPAPDRARPQGPGPDPIADSQRALLVILFNKYRAALMRHVERLVRSREDAAELVQETYLRVMRQIQSSQMEAAARAYLFQTATNLAHDHYRRGRYRAHGRLEDITEAELPPGDPPPEQLLAADQTLARLRAAILELPPQSRAVLLRARLQNQSYAQIGRELGISVRTVERRMAQAMESMTRTLRECP
jgi:RNA polymerase sigma factor (sigma-70 family)